MKRVKFVLINKNAQKSLDVYSVFEFWKTINILNIVHIQATSPNLAHYTMHELEFLVPLWRAKKFIETTLLKHKNTITYVTIIITINLHTFNPLYGKPRIFTPNSLSS